MRKFLKKIVTVVASAAMMVGAIAGMPTTEAKAATATTEIIVILSDTTGVANVLLDINDGTISQNAGITCNTGTVDTSLGWGRDMYKFVQDSTNTKMYKITVEGDVDTSASEYCNVQVILQNSSGDMIKGFKYCIQNAADTFNDNSKVYVSISTAADNWTEFTASSTDPTAITATQVAEKISAIGTVTYTAESLAKIEAAEAAVTAYTGGNSDISNYATLKEARERYNQLKAAAEAAAAGDLVIYTQNAQNWAKMNLYSWNGSTQFFGAWPGTAMTACTKNNGWFSAKFSISAPANIIFNDGDGKQTSDITDVTAGTYWYVINDDDTATVSTTAPDGWVDEAAANIEKVEDTTGNTTTAPTTGDTTPSTGDTTPVIPVVAAIALLGLAVVIMNTKKANR